MQATGPGSLVQCLARAPVFSKLTERQLDELARFALRRDYAAGEFVFLEGDLWPFALFLVSGWLRWTLADTDGRRQVLIDVSPGSLVWGHSLFDGQPMPADLEVREAAVTYRWARETLQPILAANSEAMWEVCCSLVGATRRARELLFSFVFRSVAQRLAALLLSRYPPHAGETFRRDMTLDEMAAYVGSTPALVCKTLYSFADRGMMRISRAEFEFLDRPALERIAEEGLRRAAER